MEANQEKLFQNTAISIKVRIILWNALIRSILTYALHTRELKHTDIQKLETFTFRCIKQIKETRPQYRAAHIARTQTYKELQTPTKNKTPEQLEYLKTHLYMQQKTKKRGSAIKN